MNKFTLLLALFIFMTAETQAQELLLGSSVYKTVFYEVPFGCSVKEGLGCGSAAKPVLLDLVKYKSVETAWLNRPGTVMAIVWKRRTTKEKQRAILKDAFSDWGFVPDQVDMAQYQAVFDSFKSGDGWLKEGEVDQLSFEEAEEYADILLNILVKKEWIEPEKTQPLWNEIATYFKKELVIVREADDHDRWVKEVKQIMNKYADPEKVKTITLWNRQ